MPTLTWITEKELKRVIKNKRGSKWWKWVAVKKIKVYRNTSNKIFGEHMQHSSIKIMCNWKILRFSSCKTVACSHAKQRQINVQKSVGHLQICFFFCSCFFSLWIIRLTDLVAVLIAVAAYHCTILFFFLLISILTRASLLALAKSMYIIYIYIYILLLYILLYINIYICCVKKRYRKKAVFLRWYIFVKGQLFYKNIFCNKKGHTLNVVGEFS